MHVYVVFTFMNMSQLIKSADINYLLYFAP